MLIDLRSDTVTRPTPAMRAAMAEAEVGDDHYGEDPTVNRLQEVTATLLGFEAALFLPSGTMGNAIAVRLLTRPGQEVLVDERAHLVQFELAGMAALSGVMPRLVRRPDGLITADVVRGALRPSSYALSELGLIVLENTQNLAGGVVQSVDEARATIDAARERSLRVHVDGARLWNAAVVLGVPPRALVEGADTVMVDLSKGLCAPVGALLAGSRALMDKARSVRKQLGGGMRQAGVIAAAGLVALETMIPRLAEDHANARLLGQALAQVRGATVAPVHSNIVIATLTGRTAPDAVRALAEHGVRAIAMNVSTLRLTTHKDVSRADCERAAAILPAALG
jgi:threonine aldolase